MASSPVPLPAPPVYIAGIRMPGPGSRLGREGWMVMDRGKPLAGCCGHDVGGTSASFSSGGGIKVLPSATWAKAQTLWLGGDDAPVPLFFLKEPPLLGGGAVEASVHVGGGGAQSS